MQEKAIWTRPDGFTITTNKNHLDIALIHAFLCEQSYWSQGIAKELVEKMVEHSLCYGIYTGNPEEDANVGQVGFARIVSDYVRFSWLGDVFILPEYRKMGLGKWLVGTIVEHPLLTGTAFNLSTKDAHTLYEQFGFHSVQDAEKRMVRSLNWKEIHKQHGLIQQ